MSDSNRKFINDVLASLRRQGWRVEHGSKHWKCRCPCKQHPIVRIATTPRGSRAIYNIRSELRNTCWRDDL